MRDSMYAAYQQDPVEHPRPNQRTTPRFLDGQMTYLFPLKGAAQIVEVVDASAGGLGLSSYTDKVPGSKHWLQILYRGGARRRFMVEILYCVPQTDGRFHCGARIVTLDQGDRLHWRSYQGFVQHKAVAV